MIRTAIVGLGKMGLSHLAILRTHPLVNLVAACDASAYLIDGLAKYTGLKCYKDFERLLAEEKLDAILISTPSKLHAVMVGKALARGLHVFCEKPFVLDVASGQKLVEQAEEKQLVTQVGYHYRFVAAFKEAARIVKCGALGEIHHVAATAYGPVVLRPKSSTWRSSENNGGGALYDYACHAIDAMNFVYQPPIAVSGVVRKGIFSGSVDDEIYSTLHFGENVSGTLSVNWSDESFRKMATTLTLWGRNGRLNVDRQECQLYLRKSSAALPTAPEGWSTRYTTDLTDEVWFYLRGEEYSAQLDHFFRNIAISNLNGQNCFRSALTTDRIVQTMRDFDQTPMPVLASAAQTAPKERKKSMFWT